MTRSSIVTCVYRFLAASVVGLVAAATPRAAVAQGCMPLKFLSPSLSGLQSTYLRPGEWRLGISARRVATNRFYVGSTETPDSAPGGQPLHLRLNSLDVSATYAVSGRMAITATVPFSYSTASNFYPDGNRHQVSSAGIGDVNAMADLWVLDPGSHVTGNVLVGLGLKAPTGRYHATADFWDVGGVVGQAPVPQTIQQGDGGWAVLAQAQAYTQLVPRLSVYASGQYSASLRQHTDVIWPPANVEWAVPDVYSARVGLSFVALPEAGFSVSGGWRVDGTATGDLFHAAGDYYRHAGYTQYLEPGVSLIRGPSQFTVTVPIRVRAQYLSMMTSTGTRMGSGGVNDYVIYASYTRRM